LSGSCQRSGSGRSGTGVSHHRRSRSHGSRKDRGLRNSRSCQSHQRDRFPGSDDPKSPALSGAHLRTGAQHEEIGNIVVKNVNNAPVRIQDIGTVARSTAPAFTVVSANGKPAVLLSINRQPDSNTVDVANEVRAEMESIRPTLPAGVDMRPFYDQSNIVKESINSVRDAIIVGLFLSGFIIWLFSARLGHRTHDGPRCSGHHGGDVHRDETDRPEF